MAYAEMLTPAGLAEIAEHAGGIGAEIAMLLTPNGGATGLTQAAHDAGLVVHAWTLRKENAFLPPIARIGDDPAATGRIELVWDALEAAGVDGVFTDDPGRVPPKTR